MNTIVKAVLISTAMSFSVFAGGTHGGSGSDSKSSSMMGGMMPNQKQMIRMHQDMEKNQSLMEQISNEENGSKRQELLRQHMSSMQKQMALMNQSMDLDTQGDMPAAQLSERIENMNRRMNMMQMMMEQIMEYQKQAN